jgi:hypothetical protein
VPDDARLGEGVVGLALVSRDARRRGERHDPQSLDPGLEQLGVDAQLRLEVDRDDGLPLLGLHVGEQLVAQDPGVVHDDVEPPVPRPCVLEDAGAGVLGRDVELQRGAADGVGRPGEPLAGRRDVDAHDRRAVARERAGDRRADPARGARDDRDLALERALRHEVDVRGRGVRRTHRQQLPVDERGPRRQEEPQRGEGRRRVGRGAVGQHDPVPRGARTQLLGERAQEPVDAVPGRGELR